MYSFDNDVVSTYPNFLAEFKKVWKEMCNMDTCPYKFRLVSENPKYSGENIKKKINDLSISVQNIEQMKKNSAIPWFDYAIRVLFNDNYLEKYIFNDIPICCLHFSLVPVSHKYQYPQWCQNYTKTIPVYNIVISNSISPSPHVFVAKGATYKDFYDIALNITHDRGAQQLKGLMESTAKYVNENWQGIGNSFKRLFGFGSRESRSSVFLGLKRLGDLCFSTGDYRLAIAHYQQLFAELTQDDIELEGPILVSISICSLLSTDEYDILEALSANKENQENLMVFVQSIILMAYTFITRKNWKNAYKCIVTIRSRLSKGYSYYSIISPVLIEGSAYYLRKNRSGLLLNSASREYIAIGLKHNCMICLWKAYHKLGTNGWPILKQQLLMFLNENGASTPQLLDLLSIRSFQYNQKIIDKLSSINVDDSVAIGSILAHDVVVGITGFPLSPPPKSLSPEAWASLRKRLFPVVYHPSTDRFATSAWGNDSFCDRYNTAIGESISISFKLTPLMKENQYIENIRLKFDSDENAESDLIERIDLNSTIDISLAFKASSPAFVVDGVYFDWMGVVPVFSPFKEQIRYESIDNCPLFEISIIKNSDHTYASHPYTFSVKIHKIKGNVSSLSFLVESTCPVMMSQPQIDGNHQRWNLEPNQSDYLIDLYALPDTTGIHTIHSFIAYSSNHVIRFCYDYISFKSLQFPQISTVFNNNCLLVQSEGQIKKISCPCSSIVVQENLIVFSDVIPSTDKNVYIERDIEGIMTKNNIAIPPVMIKFYASEDQKSMAYPYLFEFSMDVFLFENRNETLVLNSPNTCEWGWFGKTKYLINGYSKTHIKAKIYVNSPLTDDFGSHVSMNTNGKPIAFNRVIRIHP